jgi:hypothetical protein
MQQRIAHAFCITVRFPAAELKRTALDTSVVGKTYGNLSSSHRRGIAHESIFAIAMKI